MKRSVLTSSSRCASCWKCLPPDWRPLGRTDAHVKALQALLGRGGQPASGPGHFEETRGFHEIVLDGAANSLLDMVARPIFGVLDTRIDREGAGPGFWNEVLEDHRRIFAAIESGDEDAAAQSMLAHLELLRVRYRGLDRQRPVTLPNGRSRHHQS